MSIRVLFLGANVPGEPQLAIDEEARAVQTALRRDRRFEVIIASAPRVEDVQTYLREQPAVVHMSGHGTGEGGPIADLVAAPPGRLLFVEDRGGTVAVAVAVAPGGLGRLFAIFGGVRCAVFNACASEAQARAVAEHVEVVVYTRRAIADGHAVAFAAGFYEAIGAGDDLARAFALGCAQVEARWPRAAEAFALLARPGVEAREVRIGAPEEDDRRPARGDLLARVERIYRLRRPEATITRLPSPPPFGAHLRVETLEGGVVEARVVAAVEHALDEATLDRFQALIRAPYRGDEAVLGFDLVHGGGLPSPDLAVRAGRMRVALKSFAEVQGLIDFRGYLGRQTARLRADAVYPPGLYVTQRAQITVGREDQLVDDALSAAQELLDTPHPRFLLVLADFGTGKTFLLHELARRLGEDPEGAVIPVLVEMRALEKARSLDALLAQHLALSGMERIDLAAFRYMLDQGRIALLFDGFDELALRVSYERAAEHFDTLIEAARGNAKIVVSSRSQHFVSEHQIRSALAERADRIPGARTITLQPFGEGQIRRFLVNRLGSDEAAARRFALLDEVKDLLGLSANPRMLGFIAEVEEEKLVEAKRRDGEITSAGLYRLLIDKWIGHEHHRAHPRGTPPGLDRAQRFRAVTELATRLWTQAEKTIDVLALPADLCAAIEELGPHPIDRGEMKQQIGSGTLLVRDEEGRFSFVHQSVLEWLVANVAAAEAKQGERPAALAAREMSELMADFFGALAGQEAAARWATRALVSGAGSEEKNALRLLSRIGLLPGMGRPAQREGGLDLEGKDLRGVELRGLELRGANLRGANLEGLRLVGADLEGAVLTEARMAGADLSGAVLAGADLRKADLRRARLLGVDLRGAKLAGARLRYGALVGAKVDPGALVEADVFGMAPARPDRVDSTTASISSKALCVCVSPDGAILASGHEDDALLLWDAASGRMTRRLVGHAGSIRSVAFSPDGVTLASAADATPVHLWSVASGQLRQKLEGHEGPVTSAAFSPDGLTLATGSYDSTVRLWDVASGRPRRVLEGHLGTVRSVAFSFDGRTVASGGDDRSVRLWDASSGQERRVLKSHAAPVLGVAFSPNGEYVASASNDRSVRVWYTFAGQLRCRFAGHDGAVWSVAFSPDGQTLASASSDATVRLWDNLSERPLGVIEEHSDPVLGVAFFPDGQTLASASRDRTVRVWNVGTRQARQRLEDCGGATWGVAFSPDGKTLACSHHDNTVRLWDLISGEQKHVLAGHENAVLGVTFSPDGKTLASASHDRRACLWDVTGHPALLATMEHTGFVLDVAFSPDGETLASASRDQTVRFWEVSSGRERRRFAGLESTVLSLAFSPDGKTLAAGSHDYTVRHWDLASETLPRPLRGHQHTVLSVAFSPYGQLLASASADKTVRIWDVASGEQRRLLAGHKHTVWSVKFSPDGRTLASASADNTIRLWDAASGEQRRLLGEHTSVVRSVAFSPDGRLLASASDDGTVRLWDPATGAHLATLLPRPEGWAAVRPDGRFKLGGDIAGAFWHVVGLCRFEPGELDPHLPSPLRLRDDEPLLPPRGPTPLSL